MEQEQEKERQRMEQEEARHKMYEILLSLPKGEIAALSYILSFPTDVIWIPIDHAAGLSLFNKGCLRTARNMSANCGVLGQIVPCFAYSVSPIAREVIKNHRVELEAQWGDVPQCSDLASYQNGIQFP